MRYMSRLSDAQKKQNRMAQARAAAAQDSDALKYKSRWKKSFSATHLPYHGTPLCPTNMKFNQERECE